MSVNKNVPFKSITQLLAVGLISTSVIWTGCSGTSDEDILGDEDDQTEVDSSDRKGMEKSTRKILCAVPSPMEMAMLIKKAGAMYDTDLLNPITNVDKYSTSADQALNLGIYGADLSYTSMFSQTQESLFYLSCARKLSDKLGISGAFDEETVGRLEDNLSEKDSLMEIISDAYWESDSYLKESERFGTSALVIAGGWIEGMYIAARLSVGNQQNDQIKARIADQRPSMENLIGLLESNKADEHVQKVLGQMLELKGIMDRIEDEEVDTESSTNAESGVTTLGGGNVATLSNEILVEIDAKIGEIRNGIINGE